MVKGYSKMDDSIGKNNENSPSGKIQTRFTFYIPEEVRNAVAQDESPPLLQEHNSEEAYSNDQLNIAEEITGSSDVYTLRPKESRSDSGEFLEKARKETQVTSDDNTTEEILRSLQETEREHRRFKDISSKSSRKHILKNSYNPYEAAIYDALMVLKKLRENQSISTAKASDNWINDSNTHKTENQIHEEKIDQQVSNALEEEHLRFSDESRSKKLLLRSLDEIPNDSEKEWGGRNQLRDTNTNENVENDMDNALKSVGEEVHSGVERVLMAILDCAQGEALDDHDESNRLSQALSIILKSGTEHNLSPNRCNSTTFDTKKSSTDKEVNITEGEENIEMVDNLNSRHPSASRISVVDDLLSEALDASSPPAMMDIASSPQTIYSRLTIEQDEEDVLMRRNYNSFTPDDQEEMVVQETSISRVLGPLSSRNTTGVVLESDTELEEEDLDDEIDAMASQGGSIMDSISSVVKEAETFMSYVAGAVSPSKSFVNQDKCSIRNAKDEFSSFDAEANELMRSLCAHLLPYGVNQSTKHLSEIPPWDDRNPNEPGYRIIRLSKSQLFRVEREFERMVSEMKLSSEKRLVISRKSMYDNSFAKDLEEAEIILDREEKLREIENQERKLSEFSVDDNETRESESISEADDTTLTNHPDFPGVHKSGRGEMGDLEYFNLPIIYKSHVTGFEPTKDLYLEPGNVVAGQYLVENELGSAAFSTAYRCIDLNSDLDGNGEFHEEVCLKVIKNTKDFFDQSLDEIKILELLRQTGKCHQNNIVEMKCFFYHREHLIIVTELLRQNLFEFGKFIIDNKEEPYFTIPRLCYVTRQILVALKFVHSLGLVHSDVKPENILLASYSRAKVKVIDFGSSCYLTDRQSSYIQSRSYRAPEVVLGLPYDGRIDVWSIGCVVAEMYTGEVTFQNDSIVSMLSRIEAICGPFPRHMIAQGRQSNRYFTKSGLLYELVDPDDNRTNPVQDEDMSGLFDVFQPKSTNMASRLGLDPANMQRPARLEAHDEALFVDFCMSLLTIDPDLRPTAEEALKHPWIVAGESLTEDDIKYPST